MVRYPIWLASRSERRLQLLGQLGAVVRVEPSGVDETLLAGELPEAHVARLARSKGLAVLTGPARGTAPAVVVAADTTVVLDGRALGKPTSPEHACEMLRRLRGRTHEVLTGVWLGRTDAPRATAGVERTRVRFREYDDDLLRAYAASAEPLDKAGAYAIQGRGALLAERIDGSWSNVVGFPLERLPAWLADLGLSLGDVLDWVDPPAGAISR